MDGTKLPNQYFKARKFNIEKIPFMCLFWSIIKIYKSKKRIHPSLT